MRVSGDFVSRGTSFVARQTPCNRGNVVHTRCSPHECINMNIHSKSKRNVQPLGWWLSSHPQQLAETLTHATREAGWVRWNFTWSLLPRVPLHVL